MTRAWATLLILGACAAAPRVDVGAAPEEDGVRVCFRRARGGTGGHPAEIEAEGGRLDEVVHSPDGLTVSVLWREPRGVLRCLFPYGGTGVFARGGPTDERTFDYLFLDEEGVRVTGSVPRGCPVRPTLALEVELAPGLAPAAVVLPTGERYDLRDGGGSVRWRLPREGDFLRGGDHEIRIVCADGSERTLLVAVEPDGALAAVTGYLLGPARDPPKLVEER